MDRATAVLLLLAVSTSGAYVQMDMIFSSAKCDTESLITQYFSEGCVMSPKGVEGFSPVWFPKSFAAPKILTNLTSSYLSISQCHDQDCKDCDAPYFETGLPACEPAGSSSTLYQYSKGLPTQTPGKILTSFCEEGCKVCPFHNLENTERCIFYEFEQVLLWKCDADGSGARQFEFNPPNCTGAPNTTQHWPLGGCVDRQWTLNWCGV
mmetsp:Transcript_12889/g.18472  ORF Transcript_12889/g.18472 Transcript_12889/m.18472 type:complete len:208 (-) Transcript_12889:258-881(-)